MGKALDFLVRFFSNRKKKRPSGEEKVKRINYQIAINCNAKR